VTEPPEPVRAETAAVDPVTRLVEYYRNAAANMRALPIYNPALVVEGVGFREQDGRQVGVVVTPWFMNLTVLPAPADLKAWRRGQTARIVFPSGSYDFSVGDADEIGLVATCSLFSLMHEFTDQQSARVAALAAVDAMFEPEPPDASAQPKPAPVMSRRRFFGGG
jgi:[NiFe] hydrogenase assembly HybE family chaperone